MGTEVGYMAETVNYFHAELFLDAKFHRASCPKHLVNLKNQCPGLFLCCSLDLAFS